MTGTQMSKAACGLEKGVLKGLEQTKRDILLPKQEFLPEKSSGPEALPQGEAWI